MRKQRAVAAGCNAPSECGQRSPEFDIPASAVYHKSWSSSRSFTARLDRIASRCVTLDDQEFPVKMHTPRLIVFGILAAQFVALPGLSSQQAPSGEDYVRAHYTKYEFRIPMRDGMRLFTAVYVPKDQPCRPGPIRF